MAIMVELYTVATGGVDFLAKFYVVFCILEILVKRKPDTKSYFLRIGVCSIIVLGWMTILVTAIWMQRKDTLLLGFITIMWLGVALDNLKDYKSKKENSENKR